MHTRTLRNIAILLTLSLFAPQFVPAQATSAPKPKPPGDVERTAAGDSPDDPGPLATDLLPALTTKDIQASMRKVGTWQIRTRESYFNQQWTFAPLYDGLLTTSKTTGDPQYRDAVIRAAERFKWTLVQTRFPHADDQALGLAYLELYKANPTPEKIADVRATLDRLVVRPDDPAKNLWWWCDALFMAPPVLARMTQITGDRKYIQYMDHEWDLTTKELYDPQEHLYFRDATFLKKTEKNGQKLFWSRGNAWVLAGLAEVLQSMPANDPLRPKYVKLYQTMADRIIGLQSPDGLWRSGLLDSTSYESPEVSGTGFFTYAMTWGINEGLLDRARYTPAVTKAWAGMVSHIYADGRLGYIQPIGTAPDAVKPSSSYNYGVGAFLLAGSELDRMVSHKTKH